MSYRITKVNSEISNSANNTTLALSDLITVNNPINGQYLAKANSDYDTASVSASDVAGQTVMGRGASYSGGFYYYNTGHNYEWIRWKNDLDRGIPQFSTCVSGWCPVNNSNFRMRFLFYPQHFVNKTVILEASISPYDHNGTGYAEYQWVKGYTNSYTPLGPKVVVRSNKQADTAFGRYVSTGGNDTVCLKMVYINSNGAFRNSTGLTPNNEQIIIRMF